MFPRSEIYNYFANHKTMSKRRVVIIGGGSFGVPCAKLLSKNPQNQVTLITPHKYVVLTFSLLRLAITRNISQHSKLIKDILPDSTTVIEDKALYFDDEKVTTEVNGNIPYDALIVSTGSKWSDPIDLGAFTGSEEKNCIDYFESQYQKLTSAKDIVIVGGGILGCEWAGEIADKFRDEIASGEKNLTIYHSETQILDERYCKSLRDSVESQLKELGVNVVTGGKLELKGDGKYFDSNREEVKGDIFFKCIGGKPIVPDNGFENLTNSKGEVVIDSDFRAKEVPKRNIFVIGDASNFPTKTVLYSNEWIPVLVNNVQTFLEGGNSYQEISWPAENASHMCGVSLGTRNGAGQFPTRFGTFYVPKFVIVWFKCKTLFAGKLDELDSL